jgi:ABC-type transporter Mla MlaB component
MSRTVLQPLDSQLITGLRDFRPPACISSGEHRQTEMLRITLQEDGTLWRLHLAGRLAGAWVAETEKTWRSALGSGRPVEIDMRDVTGIDEAGLCLLRAMNRDGARFIAKGVAMEALVEEITGIPVRRRRT